jgi:hypothetical protein
MTIELKDMVSKMETKVRAMQLAMGDRKVLSKMMFPKSDQIALLREMQSDHIHHHLTASLPFQIPPGARDTQANEDRHCCDIEGGGHHHHHSHHGHLRDRPFYASHGAGSPIRMHTARSMEILNHSSAGVGSVLPGDNSTPLYPGRIDNLVSDLANTQPQPKSRHQRSRSSSPSRALLSLCALRGAQKLQDELVELEQ